MEIRYLDSHSFAENNQPALVILNISQREIKQCLWGSALDRLMVMSDSLDNATRYKQSIGFMVEGYDNDPRELWDIPAVRKYFSALTKEWPLWYWFIAPNLELHRTITAILANSKYTSTSSGAIQVHNPKSYLALVDSLSFSAFDFMTKLGIPENEALTVMQSSVAKSLP